MRETDEPKQRISPLLMVGALIVIAAAIIAGSFMLRMVTDQAPVNVVVLEADTTSFKEKPPEQAKSEDAGAKSSVMTMLDDIADNKEEIEILSLKPDAPEMPEVSVETSQAEETPSQPQATQETPSDTNEVEQNIAEAKPEAEPEPKTPSSIDEAVEAVAASEEVKPKKRPIKPLVIENPVATGPSMMVQLAAFRNQEKAQEVAALLTEKHKERLFGLILGVMQADTGSSGVFWRVTTEPLPTQDARALCDALKRAGQDCIFRKVAVQ